MKTILDSNWTFQEFVVGTSNEDAYSTAQNAVNSNIASQTLLITGWKGLGKSHLLHAVGNEVAKLGNKLVHYFPLRPCLPEVRETEESNNFFEHVRASNNADLILLDDLEVVSSNVAFISVLCDLIVTWSNNGTQIVAASRVSIDEMSWLQNVRLPPIREVQIQKGDVETKIAYLKKYLEYLGEEYTDDVIHHHARNEFNSFEDLFWSYIQLVVAPKN